MTTPDTPPVPGVPPAPAYGLRWAIKRSFIDYIRRMPDGRGYVGAGALPAGSHEVMFPPEVAGRRIAPDGTFERYWTFHGDVRFSGHFGMLSVRLAEPRIDLRGERAELSIAEGETRLSLVTLTLTPVPTEDDVELWAGTEVALTEPGVALFNDVYPAGEQFEDLQIALPRTAGSPERVRGADQRVEDSRLVERVPGVVDQDGFGLG